MRHSECAHVNMEDAPSYEQTRDLSGIVNFVAISLPLPLVPYESSDEEDNNERENNAVDSFDGYLPSMNDSAHSMTASTSSGRYEQSRNKVKVKYTEPIKELSVDTENSAMTGIRKRKSKVPSSGTARKVRQPALEAPSTVELSTEANEPLKVITKRLYCPQAGCPKVCKDKKRLDVHLKTKHAIDEYRCLVSKCERSFKYRSQLGDHLLHGHGKRSNWPCGLCSNSFLSHKTLYNHNYKVHEEGLFECSVLDCDFKATNRRSVANHQKCHRTATHTCPVVNYEPSDDEEDENERENTAVDTFDVHLPSMNDAAHSLIASTSTGPYRESPSKVSSSGTARNVRQPALEAQSTVGSPEPEKQFKVITKRLCCPQAGCPKVCKDKKNFDVHLKTKHSVEKYRCLVSKCKRSFKYRSVLSEHLRHGHGKRSNWPCDLCSSSFLSHDMLYKHNYSFHEEGLFECSLDECDFKATSRRSVANHQHTHRTAKHTCPVANCGRSYVRTSDLKSHLRLHSKERPYVCGQCEKVFRTKNHLDAHLLVHRGLMTARCTWPDCTYQAIASGNVAFHIRTAHYKLPKTQKKQAQLGIIDSRNAYDFLEKI